MSTPKRFFVNQIEEEVVLKGDEFRHAKNVLRLGVGDEIVLLDGSGTEYSAVIAQVKRDAFVAHVEKKNEISREPKAQVGLFLGLLKGDKTEFAVQKAVELGVEKIDVFSSRYCAAYMNDNKLERLNRVSKEAAKQCLRAKAPLVTYSHNFEAALGKAEKYENKLFACEFFEGKNKPIPQNGSCAVVVGSEGGFTQEEFQTALAQNFTPVTLGKRILRAETAAISLLSVVMYRLGEWQ